MWAGVASMKMHVCNAAIIAPLEVRLAFSETLAIL